jgi:hypothetical protein
MKATETLDRLKLAYSLKCPAFAPAYARVDSLIVYLDASAWPQAAAEITAMARRVKEYVRDATPPLTKKLTRGVAFAEDSGNNESFGESRCRVLAPGVLALLRNQSLSLDERLDMLIESMRAASIDPVQPWLGAACQ